MLRIDKSIFIFMLFDSPGFYILFMTNYTIFYTGASAYVPFAVNTISFSYIGSFLSF